MEGVLDLPCVLDDSPEIHRRRHDQKIFKEMKVNKGGSVEILKSFIEGKKNLKKKRVRRQVVDLTEDIEPSGTVVINSDSGDEATTEIHIESSHEDDHREIHYNVDDKKNEVGQTILHFSAVEGLIGSISSHLILEPVVYLISQQADTNTRDIGGNTPLHSLSERHGASYSKVAKILIEYGANVNAKNLEGNTPLHLAISKENLPLVQLLLEVRRYTTHQSMMLLWT